MYLLIDTETTGLDPATSRVWEIGMMIVDNDWQYQRGFSVRLKDEEILKQLRERRDTLPNLPNIDKIEETAVDVDTALNAVCEFVAENNPVAVLAYNAKFDEQFVKALIESTCFSLTQGGHMLCFLPWYCMMENVPSNYGYKCWKLGHLALDYGIAVDPSLLHGAYEDIDLARKLAHASGAKVQDVIKFAEEPWVVLRAITEKPWIDGGASSAIAKELGFSWEKAKGMDKPIDKAWVKRIKESFVAQESNRIADKIPFRIIKE